MEIERGKLTTLRTTSGEAAISTLVMMTILGGGDDSDDGDTSVVGSVNIPISLYLLFSNM
jgi:hypothetical protein